MENQSPNNRIRALQADAVRALRTFAEHERENGYKDSPYQRVEILREVASVLVDLREFFHTSDGSVDWTGRTRAYKATVAEVYDRAGVRGLERSTYSATIRYHVGNVLRERLTDEQLEDHGLRKASPRERSVEKREKQQQIYRVLVPGTASEPNRDVVRALVTAHTLLSNTEPEPREGTDLVEAIHWLDVVDEDVARLRSAVSPRHRRR